MRPPTKKQPTRTICAEAAQRSVVRAAFLLSKVRSQGLTARPEGYEVDHIIPLCERKKGTKRAGGKKRLKNDPRGTGS